MFVRSGSGPWVPCVSGVRNSPPTVEVAGVPLGPPMLIGGGCSGVEGRPSRPCREFPSGPTGGGGGTDLDLWCAGKGGTVVVGP